MARFLSGEARQYDGFIYTMHDARYGVFTLSHEGVIALRTNKRPKAQNLERFHLASRAFGDDASSYQLLYTTHFLHAEITVYTVYGIVVLNWLPISPTDRNYRRGRVCTYATLSLALISAASCPIYYQCQHFFGTVKANAPFTRLHRRPLGSWWS